ncbi:unnamed protein product, partial [Prorocentrum cordatum]
AVALGLAAPTFMGATAAVAGEPPSVGDHWYWDLGVGSLHGETASIILLVRASDWAATESGEECTGWGTMVVIILMMRLYDGPRAHHKCHTLTNTQWGHYRGPGEQSRPRRFPVDDHRHATATTSTADPYL